MASQTCHSTWMKRNKSEVVHHGQQVGSFVAAGIFEQLSWICKISSDLSQLRNSLFILNQTKPKY